MVDADERGCWGLWSLTFPAAEDRRGCHFTHFPAAGDLTAVTAFLGLTVWRGRQVLNIITKAIGDLQL